MTSALATALPLFAGAAQSAQRPGSGTADPAAARQQLQASLQRAPAHPGNAGPLTKRACAMLWAACTGNAPLAPGAIVLKDGEWDVLRVPYPMGFYTKWLDGRSNWLARSWSR